MALIFKIGYEQYVTIDSAVEVLKSLLAVEEKYADGKYTYVIKEKQNELEFKIISDSKIVVEGTESENQMYKTIAKDKEKQLSEYQKYYWDEQKKTKELEAKLKAFQDLCPDSHKKDGE